MQAKHTPGPWKASMERRIYEVHITDPSGDVVARAEYLGNIEETEANAKLIGAAPDLLEACKKLAEIFPEETINDLDAADFKDRAIKIWDVACTAKAALKKVGE